MRDAVWLGGAVGGLAAFVSAYLVALWYYTARERQRRAWLAARRPCWFCEGPEGAKLRLKGRYLEVTGHGIFPAGPIPGDCDYCRWPPTNLPKAQVRK